MASNKIVSLFITAMIFRHVAAVLVGPHVGPLCGGSCSDVYGGWVGYGLDWVLGPLIHLAVGCVGLGQLFGGLGWVKVDNMDPRTTLS